MEEDLIAIERQTRAHLDALYLGDAEALARVFLPTSALTQVFEGELRITPRDAWLDAVRARPSPAATGLPRHDHVLTIDRVGPTLAHVKVKCAIPPRYFTDLLSFVKLEGGWRVAQKVFETTLRG